MELRGNCGQRPFAEGVPGGRTLRAFASEADGLHPAGTFVPLHEIIGSAAPKPLERGITRWLGPDSPPDMHEALHMAGLFAMPTSPLVDRCPLSVASARCPSPQPAPWLSAGIEASRMASAGFGGWMPPREQTTDAVRAAAVELHGAAEAAAAWRAEHNEPAW